MRQIQVDQYTYCSPAPHFAHYAPLNYSLRRHVYTILFYFMQKVRSRYYVFRAAAELQYVCPSRQLSGFEFQAWAFKTKVHFTDRNILEDSYQLVKHFLDFPLWEYRFASFNKKLLIKRSKSLLRAVNTGSVLLANRNPPKYFFQ